MPFLARFKRVSYAPYAVTCGLGALYACGFYMHVFAALCGICGLGGMCYHVMKLSYLPENSADTLAQVEVRREKRLIRKLCLTHLIIFHFVFFLLGMYWIGLSFTKIDAPIAGVFASFGFAAMLTVVQLPGMLIFARCPMLWTAILSFSAMELIRSFMFTGLPWNLAGHMWGMQALADEAFFGCTQDVGLWMMQLTSHVGVYGLSLLTIVVSISLFVGRKWQKVMALSLMCVSMVYGMHRLSRFPADYDTNAPYVRLVQPCIDPHHKWLKEHLNDVLNKQMQLSLVNGHEKIAAIIWPEAAVPVALNQHPSLCAELAKIVPRDGYLLTGTITWDDRKEKLYSAMVALDAFANMQALHHKVHLVPFGEYLPFRKWLPFDKLTPGSVDYSEGEGIAVHTLKKLPPFAMLICYEAIFAHEIGSYASQWSKHTNDKDKARWIVNITNDAWYDNSIGLWQHLCNVRFRAIEEKVPLVRVANTGVTVVFDAVGRMHYKSQIDVVTVKDVQLPFFAKG